MNQNKIQKIFVDTNEEIPFIISKIKESKSNRIVLIIPHAAILISSIVSLKILAKQVLRLNKLVILVSDNEVAKHLSESAKLVVCDKISLIDSAMWKKANELKMSLEDDYNRVKRELLSMRKEKDESGALLVEDLVDKSKKTNKKVKAKIVDETTETKADIIKPRLKVKIEDINGFKVVCGGDIMKNRDLLDLEHLRINEVLEITPNKEDINNLNNNFNKKEMSSTDGLIGIDMASELDTSQYNDKFKKEKKKPEIFKKISSFFSGITKHISYKQLLLGSIVAVVIFFVISYFFLTSLKIEIKQSSTNFLIKKSVTATVDSNEAIDATKLTMPAKSITKTSSSSNEGVTTGEGDTGEYAQGQLGIYNRQPNKITIKAGQIFTYNYTETPLKYKAIETITIEPLSLGQVNVKADSFGEKYNISELAKDFSIEGISSSVATAQNTTVIKGGTTTKAVVLSKDDIATMKATMEESLRNELLTALKDTLGDGDILVTGTENFTENSFQTNVKEGTVVDKFTADLKMTISAVIISKDDVKNLLSEAGILEYGYTNVEIKEPVLENIKVNDKSITFDVRANAIGTTDIDLAMIRQEIKGMKVAEAREKIKGIPGVAQVTVKFSPPFIPYQMQKVPTDNSKLDIKINLVEAKN